MKITKVPKKYQPRGFEILHEDRDIIVGNKSAGFLSVAALWEKTNTIHQALNNYIRKGNAHSRKSVYVVHRLDQATSGVMIYAKTDEAKCFLKDNWPSTVKTYYAIVLGKMPKRSGLITSYLTEDDEYMMHSTSDSSKGKLAKTEYMVMKETPQFSLLKINLLTGKKNQIRVHLANEGNPILGDAKYGKGPSSKHKNLMLHSFSIEFDHPFNRKRMSIQAPFPDYFNRVIDCSSEY